MSRVKQSCNAVIQLCLLTSACLFGFSSDVFAMGSLTEVSEIADKLISQHPPKHGNKHGTKLDGLSAFTVPDSEVIQRLPVVKLKQTNPLLEIIKDIDTQRVVLVGETHTRYDHHLIQLEVLKLLHQKPEPLAIGVEWFQRPFQAHLDAYIAGEMSEQEMLEKTGYFERWRYDYRNYRAILQYARSHKIPVIALNASQELNYALSKSGIDKLPEELKAQLPDSYDWSDKAYESRLRKVFEQHVNYAGEFKDFLRGQLTWDESMAERATQYLQSNPESRLLVLAGSGHIIYGSGIPNRIKRRIDVETVSILVSEELLPADDNIADYLVLSDSLSLQSGGLIGALLGTADKGVTINGFSDNSAVKDAGLDVGTVIIGVDTGSVESFSDFKLAIMDKMPGDTVVLQYLEEAKDDRKDFKTLTVKLR